MKRSILFLLLLVMIAAAVPAAPDEVKISQILNDPYQYLMNPVTFQGKVTRYSMEKSQKIKCYVFQDNWGDEIKIVTHRNLPNPDQRFRVIGVVSISDVELGKKEANIVETERLSLSADVTAGGSGSGPKGNKWIYMLFGFAAVLLVVIAVIAFLMISNKGKDGLTTAFSSSGGSGSSGSIPTPNGFPQPESFIEDSSIKMAAPPEGTLKLLPGRLEIVGGQDVHKEIRFFKHPKQEETEFTFGREAGTPYLHIQLKSPTVSAKHAKLLWTNGKYMLINYSLTNPTKVNERELGKEESVPLEDESTVEMGEISFKYHKK